MLARLPVRQGSDLSQTEQPLIRSDQDQTEDFRRRRQKPVSGIVVTEGELLGSEGDLVGERRFSVPGGCTSHPSLSRLVEIKSALFTQDECFPRTYRGNPQFVFRISDLLLHACGKALRFTQCPEPNVGVQK